MNEFQNLILSKYFCSLFTVNYLYLHVNNASNLRHLIYGTSLKNKNIWCKIGAGWAEKTDFLLLNSLAELYNFKVFVNLCNLLLIILKVQFINLQFL